MLMFLIKGKTEEQCRARLEKLMASEMDEKCKKKPWTEEEDAKVIELVYKHGPQKWSFIAEHLPGRIGKQCRERWHNHLNPAIKKTAWTDEEEWVLFLSHNAFGNKWADIAKNIPGRTDNSIKNHWNSSMKKRIPELINRFMKIKETGGLSNPKHIAGISELEYSLLGKLLSMKNNSIVSQSKKNAAALLDTSKLKVAKSKSTNESKSRSMYTGNSMELKSFNSINKLVKHEYYAQSSSETSSNPPSQFNSLKKVKKEEGLAHNVHQVKQEFSQEAFDISRDQHMKMLEQIYFPDNFSNKESTMATVSEVVRPYSGENSMRYTEEVPIFGVKKEEENGKKMFVAKEFSLIETSPAMKIEGHHHHYNIGQYNHINHHEHEHEQNDENVNFTNFSDSVFFESPFHKKKSSSKFDNSSVSPIDNTDKSHSKILADKTNKMNTNPLQTPSVLKDFNSYNNVFSYSPLNVKYESPSKMMSFCTPERLREPQAESLSKPLAFNLNSLEKSPSLFMNKNYYSFDKSSSYKF